jgi:hypothetical protein
MSRRLWQTLEHLLDGLSEKEIAASLGISIHTVHTYVKHVYSHFSVETRAELMARFVVPVRGRRLRELIEGGQLTREFGEAADRLVWDGQEGRGWVSGVACGKAFGGCWVGIGAPQGDPAKA